jgi:CubicO group peptidase (beta-lactamase class C family)
MMRMAAVMGLAMLSLAGAAVASTAAPETAPTVRNVADDPDFQAGTRLFSAWLENRIAYRGLPGVAVGVVQDQQLVWHQGFGYADVARRVPMTAETKFRMASHSKMFAAIAIMQLREEGKLRLDDPVEKHLPWFRSQPAGDDDGPITVEQLLSHSSGLQREAGDHWSSLDFPTREELVALMGDRQAAFAPQVRWKYSNLAYAVVGMLVEELSGQDFADYVQANIFDPLGMASSSFDTPVPGLAVPYARRMPDGSRAVLSFVDARGMAAATGLTSNVEDMARYVSAQFRRGPRGGAQILSSGSWRELHRVRSMEQDWSSGFGLGFGNMRIKDRTFQGHGGGYPGNTTQTLFQLDDRFGVIVLTNTNDSDPAEIARQLITAVGPVMAKAAAEARADEVAWDPAWARFQGVYRNRWNDTAVVLMNEKLVLLALNAPSLDDAVPLTPLGDGRFRLDAPRGGAPTGEVVWFSEKAGQVVRMHTGDTWMERVPGR